MPAELLMEGKMTKAADVYSFAMLMHELLTGQQLFEGMRQSQVSLVQLLTLCVSSLCCFAVVNSRSAVRVHHDFFRCYKYPREPPETHWSFGSRLLPYSISYFLTLMHSVNPDIIAMKHRTL